MTGNNGTEIHSNGRHAHPLDVYVNDPTGSPPLGDQREFDDLMTELVADYAPRLFAVVQEYGRRVDGRIAGWGLEFEDHAEVFSDDGKTRIRARSATSSLRFFGFGTHIRPHLVWVDPSRATPPPADDPEEGDEP